MCLKVIALSSKKKKKASETRSHARCEVRFVSTGSGPELGGLLKYCILTQLLIT